MACGCPVICSNASSIPEVAGDAAEYFDAANISEMSNKIIKVLSDAKLRSRLSRKGIERSRAFSWEKCADETIEIYRQLI